METKPEFLQSYVGTHHHNIMDCSTIISHRFLHLQELLYFYIFIKFVLLNNLTITRKSVQSK